MKIYTCLLLSVVFTLFICISLFTTAALSTPPCDSNLTCQSCLSVNSDGCMWCDSNAPTGGTQGYCAPNLQEGCPATVFKTRVSPSDCADDATLAPPINSVPVINDEEDWLTPFLVIVVLVLVLAALLFGHLEKIVVRYWNRSDRHHPTRRDGSRPLESHI